MDKFAGLDKLAADIWWGCSWNKSDEMVHVEIKRCWIG